MTEKCLDIDSLDEMIQLETDDKLIEVKLNGEGLIVDIFDISKGYDNPEEVKSAYYFWEDMKGARWCKL